MGMRNSHAAFVNARRKGHGYVLKYPWMYMHSDSNYDYFKSKETKRYVKVRR